MKKISIVIPVYNEEETIHLLEKELKNLPNNFEIIIVNDGSTDKTKEFLNNFDFVKIINHSHNSGYGAALKTGIKNATSNIVAIMDSDGQHCITELLKLINSIEDYDMVVGARKQKGNIFRRPGKFILSVIANYLSGIKIPDLNSGLRIFKRDFVIQYFPILPNGFSFTTTITLAALVDGYRVKYIPIDINKRKGGHSRVNILKDGLNTLYLIVRLMVFFNPLKIFLPIALFLFGLSLFDLYYEYLHKGYFNIPDSFIILSLSSIFFFFFGVMADMICTIRKWR